MASRKTSRANLNAPMYEQLLLFPERAEYLAENRFDTYKVSLEHWKALADDFREAFETVYTLGSARVLLVHGGQGHGKSLFVRTLENDFKRSANPSKVDASNLWHVLAGGSPPSVDIIRRAVETTALRRVEPKGNWLSEERAFAKSDTHPMRIFLFDDAQKDPFVREWASLNQGDYSRLKAAGHRDTVLQSVAERIVEDCRGDFRRALFVLFSNDPRYLDELKLQLDLSHRNLAKRIELPLPSPSVKEEIVRTNTNLLNPRSYWFCLDQGGPEEKNDAYQTLMGDRGFSDSFQAIGRALAAQHRAKRSGRPANKNLLTLLTLGTSPADIASFLSDRDMNADESTAHTHIGVWWHRNRWASALNLEPGGDHSRRASLVESEFSLRWVALDLTATYVLCNGAKDDELAARLIEIVRSAPRIGDSNAAKEENRQFVRAADQALDARASEPEAISFGEQFTSSGQQRFQIYERPIAVRLGLPLSKALRIRGLLKPDIILHEYEPCEVTRATSSDDKAIELAIRRGCHVIEMTAHLQEDLRGLDTYLGDKVRVYAEMLESV